MRIELKNAINFRDGLRVLVGGMGGWHDELGFRAIHMGGPIWQNAVAGVWRVASAPVSHDGVIWDAGRSRDCVDRFHEPVVRRKGIHAIGDAFELERSLLRCLWFAADLLRGDPRLSLNMGDIG